MKTSNHNNTRFIGKLAVTLVAFASIGLANAQTLEQIRWKGEDKVREILGEPQSTKGPVGTHASYTMWEYPEFTVAFADKKAFHMFRKGGSKKMSIDENRP